MICSYFLIISCSNHEDWPDRSITEVRFSVRIHLYNTHQNLKMQLDHIFRNANLPDGSRGVDIGIKGERISIVQVGLVADTAEETNAEQCLLSPPFVDPHFHMDATLTLGQPRYNQSGTLLEGIVLWG